MRMTILETTINMLKKMQQNKVTISDCKIVKLPAIGNRDGHIAPIENEELVPFDIQRIFYLYDIPGGESRGAHAHKDCHQFLVATCGSFEVILDDGTNQKNVQLNHPSTGLLIPPGIWASEVNFSGGAICLVLASHTFDESDYLRNYDEYLKYIQL